MSESIQSHCPETQLPVLLQVQDEQISWCSRVGGKPNCAGACLKKMRVANAPSSPEATQGERVE